MKRYEILLFVILFCCVCIFGCDEGQQMIESVVESPAAVDLIPDPNLAAAVRETLSLIAATPLTAEVLQNLRTLVAPGRQIVDLTGIEHTVDLVALDLSSLSENVSNQIFDVSSLANLIKLTDLWLYSNLISDISPLTNLTNLTTLRIKRNPLDDAAINTHIPVLQERSVEVEH